MIQSINPYNNALLASYPALTAAGIELALERSDLAFQRWKSISITQKAEVLLKLAALLENNATTYAKIAVSEMGKPLKEAIAEVLKCATVCKYYAEEAERLLQPINIATENKESYVVQEPLGIILGIMPWNFPYWQVFRFAVPALMAGNTVLLKHASNVPQCALAIAELFTTAGIPENVFQTLLISATQARALVSDSRIKAVSLTGSNEAGSKVAETAGKVIKKVVLELGGSDPFIVLADADLQNAATAAIKARFQNNGQSCIAAKRFIVESSVAELFLELLQQKIAQLRTGNPMENTTDIGPLAKIEFATALQAQLEKGLAEGATLVQGGNVAGALFTPALVKVNNIANTLFSEEVFGPILPVLSVANVEEAISVANHSIYGLGASLWTNNLILAKQLVPRINTGSVFINTIVKSDARLPFGGINQSGHGRELSAAGLKEFINLKTVVLNA